MNQRDLYKQYISSNIPLLLLGKSGTGKSEILKGIAAELGMPIVDLRLSQLPPEDLNGLPSPNDQANPVSFKYLLPKWFNDFQPDAPFLLFLDEINQASPATLNALYAIVHDRMIAGKFNPNMRVVAAGNLLTESDYINELPQPLLNRFVVKQHSAVPEEVIKYLSEKYKEFPKAQSLLNAMSAVDWIKSINPRALERILKNSCVCGIYDEEEILSQCGNSKSLMCLITDVLKKDEEVEACDETLTAKKISDAKAMLSDTDAEILEQALMGKVKKKKED